MTFLPQMLVLPHFRLIIASSTRVAAFRQRRILSALTLMMMTLVTDGLDASLLGKGVGGIVKDAGAVVSGLGSLQDVARLPLKLVVEFWDGLRRSKK